MEKGSKIIIGKNSRVVELGKIILNKNAILTIGNNTSIDRLSEIIVEEDSKLEIGDNVFIGSNSNIRVTGECTVGNDCRLAQFVSLINGNYGFRDKNILIRKQDYQRGKLVIKDDVWIGLSVTILANTIIGKGAVIGAGSVITKDVLDYYIVVGNPPRIIGNRE